MIYTLEALNATRGDCLILHYGPIDKPRFMIIDGGPKNVYENTLKPRLNEIKGRWAPGSPLSIELVMVSHIDDDHIVGLVDWTEELLDEQKKGGNLSFDIIALWHNSFDDIAGNSQDGLVASFASVFGNARILMTAKEIYSNISRGMAASVADGVSLRNNAQSLNLLVNPKFKHLVMATQSGKKIVDWEEGLKFTVIAPSLKRIANLQKEWDKKLKEMRKKKTKPAELIAEAQAYLDESKTNLSSIVVLAEFDDRSNNKRMLLTGDARGDDIILGLEEAGILPKGGKMKIDLLKLPHHGSCRDVASDFFNKIIADKYVISADGTDGNPDNDTLKMLSKSRGNDKYTLYLTNRSGKEGLGPRIKRFFESEKKANKRYQVTFRGENEKSVKMDLLEPITY